MACLLRRSFISLVLHGIKAGSTYLLLRQLAQSVFSMSAQPRYATATIVGLRPIMVITNISLQRDTDIASLFLQCLG